MTVRLPAWLQTGSYTAETDRFIPTGLLTPGGATTARGGVRRWSGNEFQAVPTTPTATMQVTIKPGMAWVQGAYSSVQGVYAVVNDGDVNMAIGAAHASLARIDLVVLEILDQTYSGSSNAAQLRIVQGTPLATPVAPALTGSYIILAQIRVGAGVTSIVTSAITDVRPYAAALGGVLPVKDQASRLALTGLPSGVEVLEADTGRVYQYGYGPSGGWLYAYGGTAPLSWVNPTLLNGWTAYGLDFQPTRYRKTSTGQVELEIMSKFGSSTTILNLPAGYRPGLRLILAGRGGEPNCGVRWDILPNGDVFVQMTDAPLTGTSKWASLSATFTAEL